MRRSAARPPAAGRHTAALVLACLGLCGATAAGAEAPVASAPLLEAILARLETRGAFESEFRQCNYWVAFDEADSARGRMTLAVPNRFCLDYREPPGHRVVGDGRYVWTVVPEERQVLRAAQEATSGWGDFFYRGLESAVDSLVPAVRDPAWGAVAHIALEPRPAWGIDSLYVDVALEGAMPVGYGYIDEEGNRIDFRFTAPRFPAGVDPARFKLELPEGYELFEVD
jgi:outer membrane lipoprotein-sorting protein